MREKNEAAAAADRFGAEDLEAPADTRTELGLTSAVNSQDAGATMAKVRVVAGVGRVAGAMVLLAGRL